MPYVVGHRGAAKVLPENTVKGFRYAIELGVDMVECDVHLTRDNHLIVMHDETVDRTTNGTGPIREMDFAAIRALDAGDGEQVPTLDEVLATVQGKVTLLCELKGEGVEEAAVDAVRRRGMEKEVFFTSFHLERLARVRTLGEEYQMGAILPNPSQEDIDAAVTLRCAGVGVHYKNLCLRIVEQVKAAGLDLRAWNPDTLPEMQAMIALGADGIGTNRPDILMEYLNSSRG
jgi:glycerophosphoryl diester phosphodiesterase